MSWVELKFNTKVIPADTEGQVAYEVTASIESANGIPKELFVFDVSSRIYSNAATLRDLLTYPPTEGEAVAIGQDFFRQSSATQRFDRSAGVDEFVAYVKGTVRSTNYAWGKTQTDLMGVEEVVVYDSEAS